MMLVLSTTGAPVAWVISGVRSVMIVSPLKLNSPGGLPARGDFVEYTEEPYAMNAKR